MKVQNALTLAASAVLFTSANADITIDWVTIGNANNAADTADGDVNTTGTQMYGSVDHIYKIGKYEVTNAQYGAFLNAKGQSNTNGIYNSSMSSNGITQSGSSGTFSYSVTSGFENKPVVYVSWFDAARFSNWLGNGQGAGDTETGAYTLSNATSGIITVNVGATVYIPSEDEWYKAAYYNPATTTYTVFPNGQNTITTTDANYNNSVGSTTNVGTYSGDPSSYGTFDQGGNVGEWADGISGTSRVRRGGRFDNVESSLAAYTRGAGVPTSESNSLGFRVASVPEPTSIVLTILASCTILIRRKR
ncbi:MAG: SUMF1/EgtB/PvdO family nonheme iron enzyme [Akkermansiaceae bacterium]|nr:SUMF1/EgtB/PvdO family nonheme iron enzyme [Akkermansiaceae bacterium]